ncbi:MAG: V-type ATP synthase subunit F [Candidatus Hadarchaeota archaeon]|nr:V-type ATP synthase subunit F [Candidatus Hadarchaeota archaeon]
MKIASITDPVTATGLRLAGIKETREIEEKGEAEKLFDSLTKNEEIGVIIISERLARGMRQKLNKFSEEKKKVTPVIVEIPDRVGPLPERAETTRRLVKRAVGVEIMK